MCVPGCPNIIFVRPANTRNQAIQASGRVAAYCTYGQAAKKFTYVRSGAGNQTFLHRETKCKNIFNKAEKIYKMSKVLPPLN